MQKSQYQLVSTSWPKPIAQSSNIFVAQLVCRPDDWWPLELYRFWLLSLLSLELLTHWTDLCLKLKRLIWRFASSSDLSLTLCTLWTCLKIRVRYLKIFWPCLDFEQICPSLWSLNAMLMLTLSLHCFNCMPYDIIYLDFWMPDWLFSLVQSTFLVVVLEHATDERMFYLLHAFDRLIFIIFFEKNGTY